MKSWTYKEITEATVLQIDVAMGLARESKQKNYSESSIDHYTHIAVGAFHLWDSITRHHQKEGDRERVEAMTKI